MALATVSTATTEPTATPPGLYVGNVPQKPYVPNEVDRRVVAHLRKLIGPRARFKSRYALSREAGLDASTLSKIFSGGRGVGIDVLVQLRDGLKVSADWMLDDLPAEEKSGAIQAPDEIEESVREEVAAFKKTVPRSRDKARDRSKKAGS